ncbi:MAG: SRPBCC domain-containing protein [Nanoarchaeota archaeon]|nr:SRPBCC domain-containing protein [Nanoarchaeota archaeon]
MIFTTLKNKNQSFDFEGKYTLVVPYKLIEYKIEDERKLSVEFKDLNSKTKIIETFEPEKSNPEEIQREGWQAILNNFKKHVEEI